MTKETEEETMMVGETIKDIRPMTKAEIENEGWEPDNEKPMVIVLSNNIKLYPSQDYEGNGGGALFGTTSKGETFTVFVEGGG